MGEEAGDSSVIGGKAVAVAKVAHLTCPFVTSTDRAMQRYKAPFGGVYKLERELGKGSQGKAWLICRQEVKEVSSHRHKSIKHGHLVLKIYDDDLKVQSILMEIELYQALWQRSDLRGFAKLHNALSDMKISSTGLVLDYVGSNLDDLYIQCGKIWSIDTVAQIWLMLLDRIEIVHQCGYILRYIKGANLCMGGENGRTLYMIDLARATKYLDANGKHRTDLGTCGNEIYTSKRTDKGRGPSRRDDLETGAYAMIYFLNGGCLPWRKHGYTNMSKKKRTSNEELSCGYPAIKIYLDYAQGLSYKEEPDYSFLRKTIGSLIPATCKRKAFEWVNTKNSIGSQKGKGKRK